MAGSKKNLKRPPKMPWTTSDYPNSMKNLSPKRREKAISIANAILREGGDEGMAIATGISRSKHSSIIKLAYTGTTLRLGLGTAGAIYGGQIASAIGDKKKKHPFQTLIGAGLGGVAGAYGIPKLIQKINRNRWAKAYPSPPKPVNTHESFFKEHASGINHNDIKTKTEAHKIKKNLLKKYHPDLNPGDKAAEEKFKKISAHWDDVENGPWFQKLASMRDMLKKFSIIR
jgi:hypothetical protein